MIVSAGFLNPQYRAFNHSMQAEYENFIENSKIYLHKLLKLLNNSNDETKNNTPFSAKSHESFFNSTNKSSDQSNEEDIEKEINLYLKDCYVDEFSKFWVTRQVVYPTLFKLARTILGCPATSVPSKRLFSNASDQIWPKRNRLSVDTFEKLMLIYSSLKI